MPSDKHNAFTDETICNSDGLFWIANVVPNFEHELLTVNAACSIDIGDSLFGTRFHLLTKASVLPGHRTGSGDGDICACSRCHQTGSGKCRCGQNRLLKHESLP